MTVRATFVVLALLACCGISHGQEGRWSNFAEDADLKYYLDQKSVQSLPDNVYLFWVKSAAKEKDYFRKEYNLQNLSYIFTNYELDCAVSAYRVRGSIMFDKNRREISKTLLSTDGPYQPVPPESMMELAQDEICSREQPLAKKTEGDEAVKDGAAPGKAESGETVAAAATVAAGHQSAQAPPLPAEPSPDEPAPSPEMVPDDLPAPPPAAVEPPPPEVPAPAEPVAPEPPPSPEPEPGEPPAPAEPAAPPAPPGRPYAEAVSAAGTIGVAVPVEAAGKY